ncbi:hypothetical protein MPRF_56580 [Mycolicibacterium parafortuitum]|uniref:Uncharacterized protein n=1 Tax=Mycolicibacterium parafortuitum TaxID=39692 RepID=A0A7I7UDL3_MYCPF|nr:hypothetical protein MPRF_56580 [Mycolicibacterium parafortuitum]
MHADRLENIDRLPNWIVDIAAFVGRQPWSAYRQIRHGLGAMGRDQVGRFTKRKGPVQTLRDKLEDAVPVRGCHREDQVGAHGNLRRKLPRFERTGVPA